MENGDSKERLQNCQIIRFWPISNAFKNGHWQSCWEKRDLIVCSHRAKDAVRVALFQDKS